MFMDEDMQDGVNTDGGSTDGTAMPADETEEKKGDDMTGGDEAAAE